MNADQLAGAILMGVAGAWLAAVLIAGAMYAASVWLGSRR